MYTFKQREGKLIPKYILLSSLAPPLLRSPQVTIHSIAEVQGINRVFCNDMLSSGSSTPPTLPIKEALASIQLREVGYCCCSVV
ncbi:hypothetical protein Mic7113_1685 [Allocoleopsis franciscana PCC 7113]|uniref:Uncharacterized protein n=1 Tax=Allocoleopsis franciscana PCC 7113 TaxID=1173027 RepID=K9WDF8_9CYAN|nr:hypothetical protein Mic7113_1685 [Allocoleopsis franciscana PCC 7113]